MRRSTSAPASAIVGLFCLVLAWPAAAQPSPEVQDLARRYMVALRMDQQMAAMMSNMMPATIQRISRARGVPINAEVTEALTRAAEDTVRTMTPAMMAAMTPAVMDTFTVDELRAAVAYYESPLGQSLIAKTPKFMARAVPALNQLGPAMEKEIQARVCQEIGCETR